MMFSFRESSDQATQLRLIRNLDTEFINILTTPTSAACPEDRTLDDIIAQEAPLTDDTQSENEKSMQPHLGKRSHHQSQEAEPDMVLPTDHKRQKSDAQQQRPK
jgi:hypothetical protein